MTPHLLRFLSVSVASHAMCLFNCHGRCRIEEDETGMGSGTQCRERYNDREEEKDGKCSIIIYLFGCIFKDGHGPVFVGPHITTVSRSQNYICSDSRSLVLQSAIL